MLRKYFFEHFRLDKDYSFRCCQLCEAPYRLFKLTTPDYYDPRCFLFGHRHLALISVLVSLVSAFEIFCVFASVETFLSSYKNPLRNPNFKCYSNGSFVCPNAPKSPVFWVKLMQSSMYFCWTFCFFFRNLTSLLSPTKFWMRSENWFFAEELWTFLIVWLYLCNQKFFRNWASKLCGCLLSRLFWFQCECLLGAEEAFWRFSILYPWR